MTIQDLVNELQRLLKEEEGITSQTEVTVFQAGTDCYEYDVEELMILDAGETLAFVLRKEA